MIELKGDTLSHQLFKAFMGMPRMLIRMKRPQVFSVSLRKLLALSDELWATDFEANAVILTASAQDTTEMPSQSAFEGRPCFIFAIVGSCIMPTIGGQVSLKQGEMIYLPHDLSMHAKSDSSTQSSLLLSLTFAEAQSKASLLRAMLNSSSIHQSPLAQPLPAHVLFDRSNIKEYLTGTLSKELSQWLESTAAVNESERQLEDICHKFMTMRMPPSELM